MPELSSSPQFDLLVEEMVAEIRPSYPRLTDPELFEIAHFMVGARCAHVVGTSVEQGIMDLIGDGCTVKQIGVFASALTAFKNPDWHSAIIAMREVDLP